MTNYEGRSYAWLREECQALLAVRSHLFRERERLTYEVGSDAPLTRAYRTAQRAMTRAYTQASNALHAAAEREGIDTSRQAAEAMDRLFSTSERGSQ